MKRKSHSLLLLLTLVAVLTLSTPLNTYAVVGDNVGTSSLDLRVGEYSDTADSQTLFGLLKSILDKLAALDTMSAQMSTMYDQMTTMSAKMNNINLAISSYMLDYSLSSNNSALGCSITYIDANGASHTVSSGSGSVWVKRGSNITIQWYAKHFFYCPVNTNKVPRCVYFYSSGGSSDTLSPGSMSTLETRVIGATQDKKVVAGISISHYAYYAGTDEDYIYGSLTVT